MGRYLLLNLNEAMDAPKDREEAEGRMKPWLEWVAANKASLEVCQPVRRDGRKISGGKAGDYKAKRIDIDGLILLRADSLDEATRLAQSSPHARNGRTVIVREIMEM